MITDFVLYAPNVHSGGGFVLLNALLNSWAKPMPLVVFLDVRARAQLRVPNGARVFWVTANVASRLKAEFELRKVANTNVFVLCFHGLPPLIANRAHVVVFQQNRHYLGLTSLAQFSLKTRLRLTCERVVSRIFRYRVAEYLVQTPSMRRAVSDWLGTPVSAQKPVVKVLPFVAALPNQTKNCVERDEWDFVYVADGEAHKNHRVLLAAWRLLAQEGLRPSLALTLSARDTALKKEVETQSVAAGLRVRDLGQMSHKSVQILYTKTRALIFPSTSESFGLPLIEAAQLGLPILASELDYVRDVCDPIQTFDPASAVSIARAVKRFLAVPEPTLKLHTPQEFWQELFFDART